jgi:hypothetical protein
MREDFRTFAYTFDPKVTEHLKASVGQIVIYYPERYWSKYEPKSKVFEKVWFFWVVFFLVCRNNFYVACI